MTERSFFTIFEALEDPRNEKGKKYPLMDVIILSIYGILCGFTDFTNMAYYLKCREKELSEKLELENGVPSHDVFSDVFRLLDVSQFMSLFTSWIQSVIREKGGKHIAIDGKAVRAATKKALQGNIPYIVSAYMCDCGLTIGQKEVGAKTNEITEIPKLLDLIDISGCTVTIDAIGTQKAIMEKIIAKGGHYCLQLKNNHRTTYEGVELYYEEKLADTENRIKSHSKTEKSHGRIEKRTYYTVNNEEDIRNIVPKEWKSVKCIGMAVLQRDVNGRKSIEQHFHIMDQAREPEEYAELARGHWGIENSQHWVLDVIYGEDRSTAREDNAIANLTLLRKIAFNLAKMVPGEEKKTTKKRIIDFMVDVELFKTLIYEVLPRQALHE
ncbi:MAG: ISAs1 family transposase [Acidaminococcaceae bacterium]|nr:ISAs1 family transposase [Acidaminococcaceae bacterium]